MRYRNNNNDNNNESPNMMNLINLIFENKKDKSSFIIPISDKVLIKDAINLYYSKTGNNKENIFMFNDKELFTEAKICESGLRNNSKITVIEINKVNSIMEKMSIYGNIIRDEIEEDKNKKDPAQRKFYHPNDYKHIAQDSKLFPLFLLANNLEHCGILTAIKKDEDNNKNINNNNRNINKNNKNKINKINNKDDEDDDESIVNLQFIYSGLLSKKKYLLNFDFGKQKNDILSREGIEYKNFISDLRQKIAENFGVNYEEILITLAEKGDFPVQLIFLNDDFNELSQKNFEAKFRAIKHYENLQFLKNIYTEALMSGCILSKNFLDSRGDRSKGWAKNEFRGGKPYHSPEGWIGIGLRVFNKFDNGNNTWIGKRNAFGEWCVAYHGVGRGKDSNSVKDITVEIVTHNLKKGQRQNHKDHEDKYHPNQKVGEGVYCTPFIDIAAQYAGISEINGRKFLTVLMARVKPKAIRCCKNCSIAKDDKYWVVNGTTDEIRPYRILYKEIK